MENTAANDIGTSTGKKALWTGRVLCALAILFLSFDSVAKLLRLGPAVEGTKQVGYPESVVLGIGVVLLVCVVAYAIPRTAILGAVLLTGYLGGAIATHVRIGSPLFTHVLTPVYVAAVVWGGLYLRDRRLRALVRGALRAA
jgi:hypothetical protein